MPPIKDGLDTFDHVVVLMLENRSFDNLLGYLYPTGVPDPALGKTFEGVTGKGLSNPVPTNAAHQPPPGGNPIPVSPVGLDPHTKKQDYYQPYPDPGEQFENVNTQLFYGGNSSDPPQRKGFVADYIANYKALEDKHHDPTYDAPADAFPWTGYKQIMECYPTKALPVLCTLAQQFAVFDHWFCAVPSQTWCNRAFWNAGTSWGRVNNGPTLTWLEDSAGSTIFNQLEASKSLSWKVYSANPIVALTTLIHFKALADYHPFTLPPDIKPNPDNRFFGFKNFLSDCEAGQLPAYSFVEPRFITPHNDMHPSTLHSILYRKSSVGSVELGELYVWQVYQAIRTSPQRDRTLLIVTFDEHGGCYDHIAPGPATPPDPTRPIGQDGFDFGRLGVRVPMIMISSHIAKHTVVNTPMHHGSFMQTLRAKWNKIVPGAFPALTARVADSPEFTDVFTSKDPVAWPHIGKPEIHHEFWEQDVSQVVLGSLERKILEAVSQLPHAAEARARGMVLRDVTTINTVGEALEYMRSIPGLMPEEPLSTLA